MKQEIQNHLVNRIIPFWDSLADHENGGFYSYMGHDLIINKGAFKSSILHSRILWFYSNCYLVFREKAYLDMAKHCYDFMVKHLVDRESGGVFWSVNVKGVPANPMKHGYCNAFFIYALASYYAASGDSTSLNNAMRVFEILETRAVDKVGYSESFDRDWNPCENELASKVSGAEKTTGTILHLIEAYTELYKVSRNGDVSERLKYLLQLICYKVYDSSKQGFSEFFDKDMNRVGDVQMYGHDAEGAWLTGRAVDVLGDTLPEDLSARIRAINHTIIAKLNETAFCKCGAMYYENIGGAVNKRRAWWTQAEALVAFLDAFKLHEEQNYLGRATELWEYIKAHMIDERRGSEWFNELDENNVPDKSLPIVSEWKCPYHNGRAMLEAYSLL